jgi:hypothetical protein
LLETLPTGLREKKSATLKKKNWDDSLSYYKINVYV